MKKVLIIINDAFSYAGTENICNYMTECMAGEADVTVLSLTGSGKPFYPYSKVEQILTFEGDKNPLRSLKSYLLENHYDTVFVVSMGRLSFSVRLLFIFNFSIKRKTRFIACEHISFDSFSKSIQILKRFTLKWYNKVVVLTEKDEKKLRAFGINTVKINNPINYHYHVKTECNGTVLAVGRLNYQKGFDRLLNVWSLFIKKNSNWNLKIAGDGELLTSLRNEAVRLGIDNSVTFLGKVENLDSLYQQSDFLVMTSRYEGLPMVLLEAKSWSLPVIAFDCPTGPREIINDGLDGYLIENGNISSFVSKLGELADSKEKILELSRSTTNTFQNFDSNVVKEEWKKLI